MCGSDRVLFFVQELSAENDRLSGLNVKLRDELEDMRIYRVGARDAMVVHLSVFREVMGRGTVHFF